MQHGLATRTCTPVYMQHVHTCSIDMLQGHAAWTCRKDAQHGHAALISSTDKNHGYTAGICSRDLKKRLEWTYQRHQAWTCSKDMKCSMDAGMWHGRGHVAWTYSTDKAVWREHKAWTCSMYMLHGYATWGQNGLGILTCSLGMQFEY
jgi:hypothetical protein